MLLVNVYSTCYGGSLRKMEATHCGELKGERESCECLQLLQYYSDSLSLSSSQSSADCVSMSPGKLVSGGK